MSVRWRTCDDFPTLKVTEKEKEEERYLQLSKQNRKEGVEIERED